MPRTQTLPRGPFTVAAGFHMHQMLDEETRSQRTGNNLFSCLGALKSFSLIILYYIETNFEKREGPSKPPHQIGVTE
jgi:hypothetical protein